jgi:hypothetical protein
MGIRTMSCETILAENINSDVFERKENFAERHCLFFPHHFRSKEEETERKNAIKISLCL